MSIFSEDYYPDSDCERDGRDEPEPCDDMTDEEFADGLIEADDDMLADAEALASAGRGTDEDYGLYDNCGDWYEPDEYVWGD